MAWIALIAGAAVGAVLCLIGGYVIGHQWGYADGKTAERIRQAEQNIRLEENRREFLAAHRRPWLHDPPVKIRAKTGPIAQVPPQTALLAAAQAAVNATPPPGDDTRTDIPPVTADLPAPRFIPAPTLRPSSAAGEDRNIPAPVPETAA